MFMIAGFFVLLLALSNIQPAGMRAETLQIDQHQFLFDQLNLNYLKRPVYLFYSCDCLTFCVIEKT